MQQRPTCTNVRIRSTRDAHKIFFAVQRRILPMITRRLDADERLALCSGCVYAWEERGPHTEITGLGIERFTEGRRWSPSRVRDEFLFYYEKYTPPADSGHSGASDKQPPRDWDPLVKQTYSVWVETEKGRRKWHLTAYFTQATVDQLGTIDDIPGVAELVVPEGAFQSTRVSKNRKGDDSRSRPDVFKPPSSVARTYAPFPAAYPVQPSPSPYPGPLTPTFAQEPFRLSPQASHPSPFHHPSEIPQFSVPPPLPPLGTLHTLPPLRSHSEDIEHKFRRPSLPGAHNCQPDAPIAIKDRRASFDRFDHSRSDEYASISGPSPISRHSVALPINPSIGDKTAQYSARPALSCTYASSSRESASILDRPSSTVGLFQPISATTGQEDGTYSHDSPATAAAFPSPHGFSQHPLPPPAQLFRSEPPSQLYQVMPSEEGSIGPARVDLAPLHALRRKQPYRRDPIDDKALRLLGPRSGMSADEAYTTDDGYSDGLAKSRPF